MWKIMAWHISNTYNDLLIFTLFSNTWGIIILHILWRKNGIRHFGKQKCLASFYFLWHALYKFTRQNMRSLWTYDAMNEIKVKLAFATRFIIKVSPTSCCWTKLMTSSLATTRNNNPLLESSLAILLLEVYICTHTMCKW